MHAFIVEGQMEQAIVQKLCPSAPVRRLGANGDDVSLDVIARFAHAQILGLRNRFRPIFLIFDREKRVETVEEIRQGIIERLAQKGIETKDIKICVADREFETWIAPFLDPDGTLRLEPLRSMEGENGKSIIRQNMKNNGRIYSETAHGVKLFCSLSPAKISSISESFEYLFGNLDDSCFWKRRSTSVE